MVSLAENLGWVGNTVGTGVRETAVSDSLEIRPYRPADRERVLAVHEAALRAEGVYVERAPEPDLEDIESAYPDEDGGFLVGEVDDGVVATGALRPADGYSTEYLAVDDEAGEIKRMRVSPAQQGYGYGRRMYEALERRARERGFETLVLDTMPTLTAARRLYESVGFQEAGRERFVDREESFELLFYVKDLQP